ncbi:ABC transporter family G domain [Dillenia turbinata]|uniref:ABC transporter family G domain n=1 Tax=Dillenia turbinata TaxID=194707 RepID=A0AAN8Z3G1_9MAGN
MDAQGNVPRWTPSASPTRNSNVKASNYGEEDNNKVTTTVTSKKSFPFSSISASTTSPHVHIKEAQDLEPTKENDMKMESTRSSLTDIESINVELPNQEENEVVVTCDNNSIKQDGVLLTWKDLWVIVSSDSRENSHGRAILQGLNGYVEPGEVLALMGPSGCGKSTLLDALAGRLGSHTRQTGEILINGRKQTLAFGTSAYVTQDDTLMTTLTVREAVYYSAQLQLPDSMSTAAKKKRAETTIREMGLQDAIDTRIGGWSVKGLSGGQKRRVSICIEILTRPKLLFLDEPTSGLDSAASYHVMNRLTELARQDGRTVIASIHQPSSEVYELFNNLCLLSSGRTVYFGSASAANEFFANNGFPCPTLRNPSDHFLRTINKDFDVDIEQGLGGGVTNAEEATHILVKSYESSEACQNVLQRISAICQQKGEVLEKRGSQASFITQCLVLTRRSFVNMYRDLGYYWLRFAIYIALCICVGTIFYQVGHSYGSIQARGSMLMFVAAFLTFMAIGGFPSFVEDMKIFGRERLNGHYGVGAFVFGNTFSSIPYLLMISLIPGAIAYYLVGLQSSLDHFVYFALVLFVCMMLVESLMMIVASIVPDFLMGIITGAGIQGVMMLNGGFFRLPDDLPKPVWRYPMYYIAFHKYANQGFYKNEFEGLTFPNNQAGGPPTISGDEVLRSVWEVEMYSKWIDLGVLLGMVLVYRLMFWGIIKMVEKVKPIIRALKASSPKHSMQFMEKTPTFRVSNGKKM